MTTDRREIEVVAERGALVVLRMQLRRLPAGWLLWNGAQITGAAGIVWGIYKGVQNAVAGLPE